MAPELMKVLRVDEWPALPGGSAVYLIKGETVEEHPRWVTLKTTDAWKASLCQESQKAGRWVWVRWQESFKGDAWLRTVEPDTTKFQHDEAV